MDGFCKVVHALFAAKSKEETHLDIYWILAINVSLGEQKTLKLERIIMNHIRFIVHESWQRLKNYHENREKALNGKVTKEIWAHGHPVTIKLVTQDSVTSAEQVTYPMKTIRRGAGNTPVLVPAATVQNYYHAPKNPIGIRHDIDAQLRVLTEMDGSK